MNPATETTIARELALMRHAIQQMATMTGTRLTRAQLCDRLGVHRNTITRWLQQPGFPQPGRDGKWLLADVIAWESAK